MGSYVSVRSENWTAVQKKFRPFRQHSSLPTVAETRNRRAKSFAVFVQKNIHIIILKRDNWINLQQLTIFTKIIKNSDLRRNRRFLAAGAI